MHFSRLFEEPRSSTRHNQSIFVLICLIVANSLFPMVASAQQAPADQLPQSNSSSYVPALPAAGNGQTPPWVTQMTQRAENYFFLGTQAFDEGRFQTAREYFNLSVDYLFESGVGVHSHPALYAYYVQLIERIRQYDIQMQDTEVGWGQQTFAPSPLDLLAQVEIDETQGGSDQILGDLDFDAVSDTPEVRSFVRFFTGQKGRPTMVSGLRRAGKYFHLARRIFAEEKVPLDLIWLAQAESGWRNNALSTAAAYGIWQFIPATGSRFGLVQNSYMDERGGIEQPTRAAARYLRWLYNRYGDWLLAMGAYNCGEGNVDRALARSKNKDFWSLHRQGLLPQETRNYVPIILSIILIAKHPENYGLGNIKPEAPISYDSMPLTASIDLRLLSDTAGIPLDTLRSLNPELLRDITPPGRYQLRVPRGATAATQNVLVAMQAMEPRVTTRLVRNKKTKAGKSEKAAPATPETK